MFIGGHLNSKVPTDSASHGIRITARACAQHNDEPPHRTHPEQSPTFRTPAPPDFAGVCCTCNGSAEKTSRYMGNLLEDYAHSCSYAQYIPANLVHQKYEIRALYDTACALSYLLKQESPVTLHLLQHKKTGTCTDVQCKPPNESI
jgi:hypothetical protein